MNQANVSQFLRSYNNRNALEVERPLPDGNVNARTLKLVPNHGLLSHQRGKVWRNFCLGMYVYVMLFSGAQLCWW